MVKDKEYSLKVSTSSKIWQLGIGVIIFIIGLIFYIKEKNLTALIVGTLWLLFIGFFSWLGGKLLSKNKVIMTNLYIILDYVNGAYINQSGRYNIPYKVIKNIKIKGNTLYISIDNLYLQKFFPNLDTLGEKWHFMIPELPDQASIEIMKRCVTNNLEINKMSQQISQKDPIIVAKKLSMFYMILLAGIILGIAIFPTAFGNWNYSGGFLFFIIGTFFITEYILIRKYRVALTNQFGVLRGTSTNVIKYIYLICGIILLLLALFLYLFTKRIL
ncbi:hypothetical protein HY212_07300 [Candidatus Pacearchaeota archaeon]|nr:hypothetical protein [Candidatus Pacearchaeota archaeon]